MGHHSHQHGVETGKEGRLIVSIILNFEWFKARTGFDFLRLEKKSIDELLAKDLIKYKREGDDVRGICLKRRGFLLCDTVSSSLL